MTMSRSVDRNSPPADRLREAARTLRKRAKWASPTADPYPGGWSGFGTVKNGLQRSAMYSGPARDGYRTGTVVSVNENCDDCVPMSDADARYIESVHPGVGLALADMIEGAIQYAEEWGLSEGPLVTEALAVADQILGISADVALAELTP